MTRWYRRAVMATALGVLCLGVRPSSLAQAQHVGVTGQSVAPSQQSGTLVMQGSLTSVHTVSMTGAFSVGEAQHLTWDLPRMTALAENGYSEQFDTVAYTFDVQPDTFADSTVDGRAVRQFVWENPPAHTVIHVTETFRATVQADLSPFHSTAAYPLTGLDAQVAPYLTLTPLVTLPTGIQSLLDRFTAGKKTERAVVAAVVNWVAAHTGYDAQMTGNHVAASAVFSSHHALCRGYDNLTTGLLRALGIPVRTEFGWVTSGRMQLPGPRHGTSSIQWALPGTAGEAHAWLSVYFPDVGWVPLDPQREKFFVDSHHVAFFSSIDAGTPATGAWSADASPDVSPTGAALAHGATEFVPGDGYSSEVALHTTDSIHATLHGFTHDVQGVLLFAR